MEPWTIDRQQRLAGTGTSRFVRTYQQLPDEAQHLPLEPALQRGQARRLLQQAWTAEIHQKHTALVNCEAEAQHQALNSE